MAMQIERRPRERKVGRPTIGPKIQVHIPEEDHDWIVREYRRAGLGEEDWPELLREVVSAGIAAARRNPGQLGRRVARRRGIQ